jgi:hypothetical protein
MNVRDFGAKMDGTNDTTAFLAAYTATPANGTMYVPPGTWNVNNSVFVRSGGTGNIRFMIEGNSGLQQYIGDGDTVETMLVGRKGFYKNLVTSANGFAVLQVGLQNNNPTSFSQPTVVAGLQVTANSFAGASGYTWAHDVALSSHAGSTGAPNSTQDVGIASRVSRYGHGATWQFFGSTHDFTCQDATVNGNSVFFETNMNHNGPEVASSSYRPDTGGRVGINFANTAYVPPAWAANQAYTTLTNGTGNAASSVQPTTPNGFVYRCTAGGTSGSVQPTWPTTVGTTVIDGTVTWQCGTTRPQQISRLINAAAATETSYGAFLFTSAAYYDAILEFSTATLVDGGVKDAAIRLGANLPIDFTGNGTDAGQNLHTLRYISTGTPRLAYMAGATERLTLPDAKPVVTGSRGGNAALASFLTAMAAANLITDSTTA